MTTESMGKGITLTKEILRKMGQRKEPNNTTGCCKIRGEKILPYSSERIDPKNHVRFQ